MWVLCLCTVGEIRIFSTNSNLAIFLCSNMRTIHIVKSHIYYSTTTGSSGLSACTVWDTFGMGIYIHRLSCDTYWGFTHCPAVFLSYSNRCCSLRLEYFWRLSKENEIYPRLVIRRAYLAHLKTVTELYFSAPNAFFVLVEIKCYWGVLYCTVFWTCDGSFFSQNTVRDR